MTGFFDRMFGRPHKGSGATAKERLRLVLIHDRIDLPPERMNEMKEEILAVISKYVPVQRDHVDITLQSKDRNNTAIIAEIPFGNPALLQIMDHEETPAPDEATTPSAPIRDVDENSDLSTKPTEMP